MEQIGEGVVVGRPARRVARGRWWIATGTAVAAVALALTVILVNVIVGPQEVRCALPKVPGTDHMISWASDSRSAIFAGTNCGVSLVHVPELTVKPLPKLPDFPVDVAVPAGGRPFAVTIYSPPVTSNSGGRSRGAAYHYFVRRLSIDGKRWEQCLDNRFPLGISPDGRHVAAADRCTLRIWRLPDLSLESSVPLPQGCAGRPSSVYWTDNDELTLIVGPAPSSRWKLRLDTRKLERAGSPITIRQAAGFQVVRRRVPGESLRNWWARWHGEAPVEDWELVAAPGGTRPEYVSLGRRFTDPSDGPDGPCLIQGSTAMSAIPSPDGAYAFVPAADGSVRLWTRGQRSH